MVRFLVPYDRMSTHTHTEMREERGERREESGLPVPRTAKCRILWILCGYLRCKYLGHRYSRA